MKFIVALFVLAIFALFFEPAFTEHLKEGLGVAIIYGVLHGIAALGIFAFAAVMCGVIEE